MKAKEKKDLRGKTGKELRELLSEKRDKLSTLRVEQSQNKLKNTREIFILRHDIARILTFLREAEFVQESEKKTQEKDKKEEQL